MEGCRLRLDRLAHAAEHLRSGGLVEAVTNIGAREVLRKHRPIVYLEYCPQLSMSVLGVAGEAILQMLGEQGYQATVLHRLKPIEPLGALPVDEMIAKVTQLWQADIDAGMSHLDIRWHIPSK